MLPIRVKTEAEVEGVLSDSPRLHVWEVMKPELWTVWSYPDFQHFIFYHHKSPRMSHNSQYFTSQSHTPTVSSLGSSLHLPQAALL